MKRFKTKRKYNYLKIVIFLIMIIIFCLLSFIRLNKSYSYLINIITNDFKKDNIRIISLTKDLDKLINTYSFNSTDNPNLIIYDNNGD